MNTTNDGGPAFPEIQTAMPNEREGRYHPETYSTGGMSLRDYFAAHAPIEIHSWFNPVLPERPQDEWGATNSGMRFMNYNAAAKWCQEHVECTPTNRQWEAQAEWDKSIERERLIQWPYAWADAMLKARQT